jgi:hypothetical protein
MQIIKPYGRSHVEPGGRGRNRRVLRPRTDPQTAIEIEPFARSNDRLVIAQWISVIDKIASKPAGTNGPTTEQREFRDRLGNAVWAFLEANGLLAGLTDPAAKEHLAKLWRVKVAPYGAASYRAPPRTSRAPPSAKGRWYDRFAGDAAVSEVDVAAIAQRIHEHLYLAEYRVGGGLTKRRRGLIAARAVSIAVNVPQPAGPEGGWKAEDECVYARAGNVAERIRSAIQRRESGEDRSGTRITLSIAAVELFKHYAQVFKGDDGKPLSIREAREHAPALFNLHMAVKDCYARILKHHRKQPKTRSPGPRNPKDQGAPGAVPRKISDLLPDSMEDLFSTVADKLTNRNLSALVRLGKVIHYEASGDSADRTLGPVQNWPRDVSKSHFWTSDGQAVIKRNEAFVRVWRHVLALASRTLNDWADPAYQIKGDILLQKQTEMAVHDMFDRGHYERKVDVLFGNRAAIFKRPDNDLFERGLLRLALDGTAQLRHNAFHFKGLGNFADALTASNIKIASDLLDALRRLWETDAREYGEQLRKTMRAAHFEYFLDASQSHKFAAACSELDVAALPLPRFARMLRRAANAWSQGEGDLKLPAPANRIDLENPARLCQYTALKLIYEFPFRAWLLQCTAPILSGFIERAVKRATVAARDLNAGDDADRRDTIVARAAIVGGVREDGDVEAFFSSLSAETAAEMRVQRGYTSDPDKAREQAAYIENLKCDVVALAFATYLKEAEFEFLLALSSDLPKSQVPRCDLSSIPARQVSLRVENWEVLLYFLMHLVPVEEAGQLLHQIRKWEILVTKGSVVDPNGQPATAPETMHLRARKVQRIIELYLSMHDAKFQGGALLVGCEPFKELYESAALFNQVFAAAPGMDDDRRIPRRGLREIMRFGHLRVFRDLFMQHPIRAAEVARYAQGEALEDGKSKIAHWQELRESLHEKWTGTGRAFPLEDVRTYVDALARVMRHRHLAAHVTLTDHVRLHRLLMTILGRLVDYSGLWERDLYFATLALAHELGTTPQQVFAANGLRYLGNGQIIQALRNRQPSAIASALGDHLSEHFGTIFEKGNSAVRIRNYLAHFNMLRPDRLPVGLTECVNAARQLMGHDRKLKNAVSKSIKEKLHREGLTIAWAMEMTPGHRLGAATLETRQARHLGKVSLRERSGTGREGQRRRQYPIVENLHSEHFVGMVAALVGQCTTRPQKSVIDIPLERIDWRPFGGEMRSRAGRGAIDTSRVPPGAPSPERD